MKTEALFQKPQINLARSTPDRMWLAAGAAFLAVLQSSLGDSFHSLALALAALAGTFLPEVLFSLKERFRSLRDGSAAASAMVLTLLLPNRLPPLYAFAGAFFAMTVIKHSFGGLGSNWVNPAAGAWLFIRFSWPDVFDACLENSLLGGLSASLQQGLSDPQGSPLLLLKINGWQESAADTAVSGFLNNTVFSFTGIRVSEGYLSLFSAPGPGIIADRGLFFLILGTMLLAAARCFRCTLPLLFLFVYCLLVRMFGAIPFGGKFWAGDVLFAVLSGGVIAAAFFLVLDPATAPKSARGAALYVALSACFAWLFRFPGFEPYGAVPAVLLGNVFVPVIRSVESAVLYKQRSAA
jgi:electron transport complex protein RnfD